MDLMHLKNKFLSNILVLLLFHLTFFLQGTPVPFTDVTDESKIDFPCWWDFSLVRPNLG